MGTWGAGIFENDLAAAIRAEFEAALHEGLSVYAAADRILEKHAGRLHDPDEGQAIYYALAALQLEHGTVSSKVRKRALTTINSGEGLERWHNAAPKLFEDRMRVEQDLRRQLVALG